MIKIIINKNILASWFRNRPIVISMVPIVLSSRRYRRSRIIWIKTTIGMTIFWVKAIRLIPFRNFKMHVYFKLDSDMKFQIISSTIGNIKCPKKYMKDKFCTWWHMLFKCPKVEQCPSYIFGEFHVTPFPRNRNLI